MKKIGLGGRPIFYHVDLPLGARGGIISRDASYKDVNRKTIENQQHSFIFKTLLAFIDKYGVLTNQRT